MYQKLCVKHKFHVITNISQFQHAKIKITRELTKKLTRIRRLRIEDYKEKKKVILK